MLEKLAHYKWWLLGGGIGAWIGYRYIARNKAETTAEPTGASQMGPSLILPQTSLPGSLLYGAGGGPALGFDVGAPSAASPAPSSSGGGITVDDIVSLIGKIASVVPQVQAPAQTPPIVVNVPAPTTAPPVPIPSPVAAPVPSPTPVAVAPTNLPPSPAQVFTPGWVQASFYDIFGKKPGKAAELSNWLVQDFNPALAFDNRQLKSLEKRLPFLTTAQEKLIMQRAATSLQYQP